MKAKSILIVSLVFNVILLALGGVVLREDRLRPKAIAPSESVAVAVVPKEVPAPAATAPEPFRWIQLESSDDAAYIRNLRSAGCPEITIRDIVVSMIGRRYDQKREALHAQRQKGELDSISLDNAVAKSWDEQNDLLAELFGTPKSFGSGGVITKEGVSVSLGSSSHPLPPAGLSSNTAPLAFLDPDPSWGLSEDQLLIWNQVGDRFAKAVGTGQNPADPAYLRRWQEAQVEADEELRAQFGNESVAEWQLKARSRMPPPSAK